MVVAEHPRCMAAADVIINIPARRKDLGPPVTIMTPDALKLRHAPLAARRSPLAARRLRAPCGGIKRQREPPRIVGNLLHAEIA
jgi:hypothetical protein